MDDPDTPGDDHPRDPGPAGGPPQRADPSTPRPAPGDDDQSFEPPDAESEPDDGWVPA